ncbi:hypothetical protein LINPERPRIM_LOCUS35881 [Linum perenne]
MASLSSSSLTRKPLLKETGEPLKLRDFLMDDFSSCSSNGFKSFPRRQCCPSTPRLTLRPSDRRSKPSPTPIFRKPRRSSAFRKASKAVIKAVRSLPLRSAAAASGGGGGSKPLHLLPRSLSRKILRKSLFWRRDEINLNVVVSVGGEASAAVSVAEAPVTGRWRSFREFLEEKVEDHTPPSEKPFHGGIAPFEAAAAGRISTSCSSNSHSKSDSKNWSESEFTADSGGSESCSGGKNDLPESGDGDGVSGSAAVTAGEESTTAETAKRSMVDESSKACGIYGHGTRGALKFPWRGQMIRRRSSSVRCSKKKPMKRVRRFDCLNQLQPTNLQTRITVIEESSSSSPLHSYNNLFSMTRKDPLELLTIVKERASSSGCSISKCDQLLFLDFFEEKLLRKGYVEDEDDDPLLEEVEEWVKGEAKEMLVGWEVNESRNVYLRDMEENGGWRNYVCEVEDELGFDMGLEILGSLVDEVVLELLFSWC